MLKIPASPEQEPIQFRQYVEERVRILREIDAYAEITDIAREYGATLDDIFSNSKRVHATRARAHITALLKERYDWSYHHIAEFFGHVDHSTARQAVLRHEQRVQKGQLP